MVTESDKISFVIPCYNAAKWIALAIESIFNNNFEPGDEIICVEDCSTDGTDEMLRKLQSKYNFKVIFNSQNRGCPASRNVGFREANNNLFMNLDADNLLIPHSISKLKQYLIEKKADMAHFNQIHFFQRESTAITHKWLFPEGQFYLRDFLAGHINPGPAGNFMHTREGWEEVGGYSEHDDGTHEAWGYTLKRLAFGANFVIAPFGYYRHRHGNDSLFSRPNWSKNSAKVANKMINQFLYMLDIDDRQYVEDNRDTWFINLNKRPLKVFGQQEGRSGQVIRN